MCRNHHRRESSDGEIWPASGQVDAFLVSGAQSHHVVDDHHQSMVIDSPYGPRRRSVDIGGLALALNTVSLGDEGTGKGWIGGDENEAEETHYAELLSDMYTQTQNAVNMPVTSPPLEVSDASRRRLIVALDSWHFEPHLLPDEEVLACTQILFEALFRVEGLAEAIDVSLAQMARFLLHLRQAYRSSNSYHNFQHALDVFQATYMYLRKANAVPSVSILLSGPGVMWKPPPIRNAVVGILRNEDLFALCIAAVGHDVGHPGFNNMFMKNAQAPLSQVYDHKSALERMHCAFLLPIMKRHGLEHLLDRRVDGAQFRKLLLETVLATDMGVHKNFMERFKNLIENPGQYDVAQARILVCQALIKCADISNPSRPHTVSQHWSAALAAEWASQALLERQLCLPVSVQDSDDPVTEAKGQISFIQAFCLPLLEITAIAIPDMRCFVEQCALNCQQWAKRLVELTTQPPEPNYPPVPYRPVSPPQPHDLLSVFPLSLPAGFSAGGAFGPQMAMRMHISEERLLRFAAAAASSGLDLGNMNVDTESVSEHSQGISCDGSSIATPGDGSRASSPYAFASSTSTGVNGGPTGNAGMNGTVIGNGCTPVVPHKPLPAISTKAMSPSTMMFSPIDYSASTTPSTLSSQSPRSEYAFAPHTPGSVSHSASGSVTSAYTSASGTGTNHSQSHSHSASTSSHTTNSSISSAFHAPIGTGAIQAQVQEPISSIRAAYKLSVRKKKSFHRNSWAPSPSSLSAFSVPAVPAAHGGASVSVSGIPRSGLGAGVASGSVDVEM